jgi:hypothetical protein
MKHKEESSGADAYSVAGARVIVHAGMTQDQEKKSGAGFKAYQGRGGLTSHNGASKGDRRHRSETEQREV